MKKLFFFYFFVIILFNSTILKANNVKIITKIGTDIITNIDIDNEYKYLVALNDNYKSIEKNKIYDYAKESLIREKIKEIEIKKFFDLGNKDDYLDDRVKAIYQNLGFLNIEEFNNHLKKNKLDLNEIFRKIEIEIKWNQLIFEKYNNKIIINKESLKEKLIKESKISYSYNLSEIVFSIKDRSDFENKFNSIIKSINDIGFEKTVLIYSESNSVNKSGNLGWIDELSLSKIILNEIKKINVSEITKPIKISNGILILKLNEIKEIDYTIENIDDELSKLVNFERNKQLNTFSSIYFNKIKEKILANES